jgi:hypothetical protein
LLNLFCVDLVAPECDTQSLNYKLRAPRNVVLASQGGYRKKEKNTSIYPIINYFRRTGIRSYDTWKFEGYAKLMIH